MKAKGEKLTSVRNNMVNDLVDLFLLFTLFVQMSRVVYLEPDDSGPWKFSRGSFILF